MEYLINLTGEENEKILNKNLNGRIYNGVSILSVIILVQIKLLYDGGGAFRFYAVSLIALIFASILYIPYTIKRTKTIKNIISYINVLNNQVIFRTSEVEILFGKIKYEVGEFQIDQNSEVVVEIDSEVKLTEFKTEIISLEVNGTKYYVVGAYFKHYEALKDELFPFFKRMVTI